MYKHLQSTDTNTLSIFPAYKDYHGQWREGSRISWSAMEVRACFERKRRNFTHPTVSTGIRTRYWPGFDFSTCAYSRITQFSCS